jgi:hypothetical protein
VQGQAVGGIQKIQDPAAVFANRRAAKFTVRVLDEQKSRALCGLNGLHAAFVGKLQSVARREDVGCRGPIKFNKD